MVIFDLDQENCYFFKVVNQNSTLQIIRQKHIFISIITAFSLPPPRKIFWGNICEIHISSCYPAISVLLWYYLKNILVTEHKGTWRNGIARVHNICLPWTPKPKRSDTHLQLTASFSSSLALRLAIQSGTYYLFLLLPYLIKTKCSVTSLE